jgi:hypothetical protein
MQQLNISTILKYKSPCYFVSPHFDDAVLSAGYLITELAKNTEVTVINVFTKTLDTPNTVSIKKFLLNTKYKNGVDLYAQRAKEDYEILRSINVHQINLGFVEAMWRQKEHLSPISEFLSTYIPEVQYVYPTYRFHVNQGHISSNDRQLLRDIVIRLKKIIPDNALIFCPSAIGNHVDHVIVKDSVSKLYKPIYWIDQPYLYRCKEVCLQSMNKTNNIQYFPIQKSKKENLISKYLTQIPSLFNSQKLPELREYFMFP